MDSVVAASWERLSKSGGDNADIRHALKFINENWSRATEEFVATRKWGRLSTEEEARQLASLGKESVTNIRLFETLVTGVSKGPVVREFFASLRGHTRALKLLAYSKGFSSASEENQVLILVALSMESQNLIEACAANLADGALALTFLDFMRSPSGALKLADHPSAEPRRKDKVDLLFGVASRKVADQVELIRSLPTEEKLSLSNMARRLIDKLPHESFGKYARLRLSVFSCLAPANEEARDQAKLLLMSEPQPAVVDILMATEGSKGLRVVFEEITNTRADLYPTFTAHLVDLLRNNSQDFLKAHNSKLKGWAKSKSQILALASQAALLTIQEVGARDFETTFLRAAKSAERDGISQWLTENPESLESIRLGKLPRAIWKTFLKSFLLTKPAFARKFLEARLGRSVDERDWQDTIETLVQTSTDDSEGILYKLVFEKIQSNPATYQSGSIKLAPLRAFIRRKYWDLTIQLDDKNKFLLFDAIRSGMSPMDVLQLVRSGLSSQSSDWVLNSFVPHLLTIEALNADFGSAIPASSQKELLAKHLSVLALANWQYLKEFPEMWASRRKATKIHMLGNLQGALSVALVNTRENSSLSSSLTRLSRSLDEWSAKDAPASDSEYKIANTFDTPGLIAEDVKMLENYFKQQPKNPHDLILFLGLNTWAFKYLFHEQRTWPSEGIIFESICKSFIFISGLHRGAQEDINTIEKAVLVDLGIVMRTAIADIESDIAGYYAFRYALDELGLHPIAPKLGVLFKDSDRASNQYRIVRDPGRMGRLRVFSAGLKTANNILDRATVTQSGVDDDRD